LLRNQGCGAARQIANAGRTLKNNRGAADYVLPNQGRCSTGDVLRQAQQALAGDRGNQDRRNALKKCCMSQ
jgi:hypothetical protein